MSNRKYDREFKINAVKLYRESGKSQKDIANELGLSKSTLYSWISEFKESGEKSFPGSVKLKPCNEELYLLRKEIVSIKQERDILKKALAIFSKAKS